MPWGSIVTILLPLIEHLVDHMMKKDTSTMSVEEIEQHQANLACLNGMCDHARKIS